MNVVFSERPFEEVEIAGTRAEWLALSMALREDGSVVPGEPVLNPAPFSGCARCIVIRHHPGEKVKLAMAPFADLVIQGDPALLVILSETMSNFGQDFEEGCHIHIDFQGDEHFIAKESASTVLILKETQL